MKSQICRPWICSGLLLPFLLTAAPGMVFADIIKAEVKLTGITALFGGKQVLLSVREPGEPGQPCRPAYACTLREGESSGPIRVLQIDEIAGRIRIANGESEEDLTFSRNGVPAPVLPATACARSSGYYAAVWQPAMVYPGASSCVTPQNQLIILGSGYRSSSFSSLPSRSFSSRSTFVSGSSYSSCYGPSSFSTCRTMVSCGTRGGSSGRSRPCR